MTITKTLNGSECILTVEGRLDAESAPKLRAVVETLDEVSDLTLDFSRLLYISSAGLRVLLLMQKSGAKVRLTGVNDAVWEILETTGFIDIFEVGR
jgi:anti-sigma B factor antagonist